MRRSQKKKAAAPVTKRKRAEYAPRYTKRQLEQMQICLNCPYPINWCDGEPSHCAGRAAQEERRKQADES